jgi:glycosyltransferase involved in cell wall biosynthesis
VDCLLEAICLLSEDSKSQILIRFVGKVPPSVEKKFRSAGLEIELVGYVDHGKSVEYLFRSDLLLLVIPKVKNNQGILTGKFFEYLASQKPILAIGPTDGDLAKIILETNCGQLFDYNDSKGMLQFIQETLEKRETNIPPEQAYQYSRKELTRKITKLFEA